MCSIIGRYTTGTTFHIPLLVFGLSLTSISVQIPNELIYIRKRLYRGLSGTLKSKIMTLKQKAKVCAAYVRSSMNNRSEIWAMNGEQHNRLGRACCGSK